MRDAEYARAADFADAIRLLQSRDDAMCIAGGTTVVDLMQERVLQPGLLVDISRIAASEVNVGDGAAQIGALALMSDVARDARMQAAFPLVTDALRESASPQLRNMATIGGNLLQRTRCVYFRDVQTPCNKREPGQGCSAAGGWNRMHAILGGSEHCIAVHPSDLAVALTACEAQVRIAGPGGERIVQLNDFYRLPGETPHIEHDLARDEVITAVRLPRMPCLRRSAYVKVRDRASFEFALASAAAALEIEGGKIVQARLALGGVATKPWRVPEAERALTGVVPDMAAFESAARIALTGARGWGENDFKIALAQKAAVRALSQAARVA
jgi:xanthine dehydrogenase YagS FAD-binding subunit